MALASASSHEKNQWATNKTRIPSLEAIRREPFCQYDIGDSFSKTAHGPLSHAWKDMFARAHEAGRLPDLYNKGQREKYPKPDTYCVVIDDHNVFLPTQAQGELWSNPSSKEQKAAFDAYAIVEMTPMAHLLRAHYCHRNPNVTLICIPGSGISEIAGIVSRIVHSNTWFQITGVAAVSIRAYVAGNDYIRKQKPLSQYVEESTWNSNAKRWRDELIDVSAYEIPKEIKDGVDFKIRSADHATNFR